MAFSLFLHILSITSILPSGDPLEALSDPKNKLKAQFKYLFNYKKKESSKELLDKAHLTLKIVLDGNPLGVTPSRQHQKYQLYIKFD